MSDIHKVAATDFVFGNGWVPGSSRRVVVKEHDHSWSITRVDHSGSVFSALGVVLCLALLGTLQQILQSTIYTI